MPLRLEVTAGKKPCKFLDAKPKCVYNISTKELEMEQFKASIQSSQQLITNILVSSHFSTQIKELQETSDIK